MMFDRAAVIEQVGQALISNQVAVAKDVLRDHYPFAGLTKQSRQYTKVAMLRIFHRDGFINRYAGTRLIFPGALRLISAILPSEFPFHPNWKMSVTHPAYWELLPTIDHVAPVARGGINQGTNCVPTSQLRNSAKSNWTVAELGWTLYPAGQLADWDGMTGWFCQMIEDNAALRESPYLISWYRATQLISD
jgi:hypothetical protein